MHHKMRLDDKTTTCIYKTILTELVAPLLTAKGFRRARGYWFLRWEGDALWRVSCSLRTEPNEDEGLVGVQVCVGFRSLEEFMEGFDTSPLRNPKTPCIMATEIGHLMPQARWHQWRLLPEDDPHVIGHEIATAIEQYGLDYFAKYGSVDKALAAWEQGINYNLCSRADFYIAAVYWLRGDRQRAIGFINRSIERYEALYQAQRQPSDRNLIKERQVFLKFLEEKSPRASGTK